MNKRHIYRFLGQCIKQEGDFELWRIEADESKHLKKVLRLKAHDTVEVFDAKGRSVEGVLLDVNEKEVCVRGRPCLPRPLLKYPFHISIGALKPSTADELIAPLAELSVSSINFFMQEGVAKKRFSSSVQDRWDRLLLAAVKQCKRDYLPEIRTWDSLGQLLQGSEGLSCKGVFLDEKADSRQHLNSCKLIPDAPVHLVIGGELGLGQEEREELVQYKFEGASLGPYVLRAKTAALASAALLLSRSF